jgi:predicted enzyme related to lactoylglutathione lyase
MEMTWQSTTAWSVSTGAADGADTVKKAKTAGGKVIAAPMEVE